MRASLLWVLAAVLGCAAFLCATPGLAHCPQGMTLARRYQGPYCVDRFEASVVVATRGGELPHPGNQRPHRVLGRARAVSVKGIKPQGYVSHDEAALLCKASKKRLCEVDEWMHACRGARSSLYPYGHQRRKNLCNDRFKQLTFHPVYRLFKRVFARGTPQAEMWTMPFMNDPRLHELDHTVFPTGSFAECVSDYGIYDLVGNLHEWVADEHGTFVGGYFMDTYQNGEGCSYRTTFHPSDYHDYSTGFRCCADVLPTP